MNYDPMQHLTVDQQAEVDKANAKARTKPLPVSKVAALEAFNVLVSNYGIVPLNQYWQTVEKRLKGE